jgi:HK97 family phage major capsid protein
MCRVARSVLLTAGDTWKGVSSAGVTTEWLAEETEAADGSPTLAGPSIPVHKAACFAPVSFELFAEPEVQSELARIMLDAAAVQQDTAFTTGSGNGQPTGIITALAGTGSEINTQGSEATAATDPYDLQDALPARFSERAVFMSHIAIRNEYAQMETSNGALKSPGLQDVPPTLLGRQHLENNRMDRAYDAGATANNYVPVYGDFDAGYRIVDRIGTTVEVIQNLVGSNQRPTGQRRLFMWYRVGGDSVIDGAFRMLDVPTTA